ncbi:MAG: FmdB family zinc ribbon protein [Dehalococcoidia bacterium]
MPVYEYRCEKCGNQYEKREGFEAPARQKCPKCRGKALRVLHAASVVFKGSGFYITDNRKTPAESSTDSAPMKSDDGASTKSDDGASTKTASAKSNDSPASKTPDKPATESAAAT